MHICVTGGCGFIGTHLVEKLVELGHRVRVCDLAPPSIPVPGVSYVTGDLFDTAMIERAMDGVDAVFHLAAISSVPQCDQAAIRAFQSNFGTSVRILERLREIRRSGKVVPFFFASSSAIYGFSSKKPIKETEFPSPISLYGLQKLETEQAMRVYSSRFGIPSLSLRLFNVYGPGQRADSEFSGVISRFVDAIKNGRSISLHGGGNQTRDFVFIDDTISAMIRALALPSSELTGNTFNIASGKTISIRNLATLLSKMHGRKTPLLKTPARENDILHSCGSILLAKRKLRWTPEVSLEEGLSRLLNSQEEKKAA